MTRIAYLAAGAAGMYCGSCLHDNTLAAALIEQGDETLLIPTYTPLRTDEPDVSVPKLFYGGVNVYLQEKLALFRHTPWWLDRLFNAPKMVDALAKMGPAIDPHKLGGMTVSMLAGEHGNQKKELDKLTGWLADDVRPDVVHLSNSMLVGMARQLRQRLGVPIVCSLSGEDIFLEKLAPPYYEQARRLLRERSQEIDAFVALNHYYADFMADYLAVPRQRIEVIPHGLQLAGHAARPRKGSGEATIGYLARVCHDKGMHLLVEAFVRLNQVPDLPPLQLRVAGYLGKGDRAYLRELESRLRQAGLQARYEYLGEPNRAEKIALLQSLDVLALPTVYRESKGLPVLEAWANAVPVVLPAHGAFPEMVADTGGGILHAPGDAADLAEKLADLLRRPDQAEALGQAGHAAVHARYHAPLMAQRHQQLYRRLTR